MELHNKAVAIANLIRMGYHKTLLKYIADDWQNHQKQFSLHALTSVGSKDLPCYESGLNFDVGGKIFMSCHYGSYPHVINSIAQKAKDRTIYVIVGSESDSLKNALTSCAQNANFSINFIDGGFGLLKRIKRAVEDHYPLFVEIDVPWGANDECNVTFPFVGGEIKAKDALFRLIERLGIEKNFVLSSCGDNSISVINYGDLSQSQCFQVFSDHVQNSPHQYERLFQMHNYFKPKTLPNAVVHWKGAQSQYVIHTSDMKAWAVKHDLFESTHIETDVSKLINRNVDYVISI